MEIGVVGERQLARFGRLRQGVLIRFGLIRIEDDVIDIAAEIARRCLVTGLAGLCPPRRRCVRYLIEAHRVAQAGHGDEGQAEPTRYHTDYDQV